MRVGLGGDKLHADGEEVGFYPCNGELHHPGAVGGVDDRKSPLQDVLLGVKLVLPSHLPHHWSSHSTPVSGVWVGRGREGEREREREREGEREREREGERGREREREYVCVCVWSEE